MNNLATSNHIQFAFFLQPVAGVGKSLSDAEQSFINDTSYKDDYLEMEQRLLQLKKENIHFHSLTALFSNHPETLYQDGIHLDPDKGGLEILNKAIVDALVADWKLRPR